MRLLANKSIAFLISASFLLAGCSDSGPATPHNGMAPTENSEGEVELPKVQIASLEVPNTEDLGIVHNGERLRLGDLREIGLEWVWRLIQEPSRMWRRYILGNPLFLYRVWKQARQEAKS